MLATLEIDDVNQGTDEAAAAATERWFAIRRWGTPYSASRQATDGPSQITKKNRRHALSGFANL